MKTRLLILSLATLCVSAAPAFADLYVDFYAAVTEMTVETPPGGDGTVATATVVGVAGTSMDISIIDDDGVIAPQFLLNERPYNLTAVLNFTGMANDYSATGSLVIDDTVGTKVAAAFESSYVEFNVINAIRSDIHVEGFLSPLGSNKSILSENISWEFVGNTGTISLAANAASYDTGTMVVFDYTIYDSEVGTYWTLQSFLANDGARAQGNLQANIVPVPAALLLGVVGLGVVGLKLRKYA